MRIHSLTLQGFKSFGHRTRIECSVGVTAIVGPNGSGKSNLLDALKWVTGGGRAREFRAEARTDLIFHGAEGKRGVGYAEVEVELSDGQRRINIRRDLDRAGSSRLRLDGRQARFMDIDEALAGSGLGTSGVAMIGQGEIAGVLMADAATLLRYVAEAAGVARLAARRDQTQARLDTASAHLQRLDDVLWALRARFDHLRHEAQVAGRSQALRRDALSLRVTAGHARVAALETELGGLRLQVAVAEQALLQGRERLTAARRRSDQLARERAEHERSYREALASSERAHGRVALAEAAWRRALEQRETARQAAAGAQAEADTLAGSEAPVDPGIDLPQLREVAYQAQTAVTEQRAARALAELALTSARQHLERKRQLASLAAAAWSAHEARQTALREEGERLAAEREALVVNWPTLDVVALEGLRAAARASLLAAEAALEVARAGLEAAHAQHANAHGEALAAERHQRASEQAFRARQGYAQGPRAALTCGVAGVIGSVADILTVPEYYQIAIAGALGRRVEYVIVTTATIGAQVLTAVRDAGGWVTLLPLNLLRSRPALNVPLPEGALDWAASVVEVEPRYARVVEQLLGHTALVADLARATTIARDASERPRLVTLAGEMIEASGAMSGGRRSGGATVLGLGRDLERAEAEHARCQAALRVALEVREQAAQRVREQQARVGEARTHLAARDGAYRSASAARDQQRERTEAIAAREQRWQQMLADLRPPDAPHSSPDVDTAEAQERAAQALLRDLQGATEAALRVAAEASREAEVGAERLLAFETAKLAYTQALDRALQLRQVAVERAREVVAWGAEVQRTALHLETAKAAVPLNLEAQQHAFEDAEAAVREAEREQQALAEAQGLAAEQLEGLRLGTARREAALELALDERAALPDGVELLELGERAARARLREVEAELEGLGPVNHRAALDHASQVERLSELESEGAQAATAVHELSAILETIDRETTSRLNTALLGLREGFAEHVRQLFGATAVAGVEVERQGERPTGVRIRLQPPGKRTESLNLLSVGERTMGALAFLFALMAGDAGRLPIAVLDEVDAPLDEANIRRFCGFVESLASQGTQFVLITHQKATFEVADTLWGVTTEAGVSRVFSMRRDEPSARAAGTA